MSHGRTFRLSALLQGKKVLCGRWLRTYIRDFHGIGRSPSWSSRFDISKLPPSACRWRSANTMKPSMESLWTVRTQVHLFLQPLTTLWLISETWISNCFYSQSCSESALNKSSRRTLDFRSFTGDWWFYRVIMFNSHEIRKYTLPAFHQVLFEKIVCYSIPLKPWI